MSTGKRRPARTAAAEVAGRMADAVTYLSRVADGAGMEQISADLLSIRRRLALEAKLSKRFRETELSQQTKARRIK